MRSDPAGQRFGRLTVVGASPAALGRCKVECRCDCGQTVHVRTDHLRSGATLSCGCYGRERRAGCSRRDLIGQRFGRLTVKGDSGERSGSNVVWECVCDCGQVTRVASNSLRTGNTRSCGCYRVDKSRAKATTHGRSGTPEYRLLKSARYRAKKLGVACTITLDDVVIPDVCPAIGIPLTQGARALHDGSPTLDRLVPDKGYVPNNVVVISMLANRIKQEAESAQVLAVAEWMESMGL